MPASDVTLSAGFTANKYLVTFVLDGELFKTDSVTFGTEIILPEIEEREGFSFSGWQNVPETMPASDVTLSAGFTPNKYLVTFVLDGEIFKTDSVTFGTEIILPEVAEKEGHTFSGWQNVPETMPASDVRIEANFTENKYLVTFMLDGEIIKTDSVTYGTEITLPEVAEKEGHTFSGWQNVPETMPASDVRIEATFTANKYLVTFILDGEIFKTDSVTYGTEITLPEIEEREGHTFSGWQNVPETMPANDMIIEGTFTVNIYAIIYKVDGEIYAVDSVAYGANIVLREEPVREGYKFSGWSQVAETMPAADVEVTGCFTVGIGELRAESKVNVYNLQGKVLYRQVRLKDVYNNLPQGIYVVSGKKLMIK
ncbi:MAG: InlB B-repeat-containing protein, partial [Bacteroidales bacterium]|nr:InlB B-repeat-containing protein [Bacteroidales bacterium]